MSKHRVYALLLILGSSFLIYRTIALLADGLLIWATWWVSVLLFAELIIDLGCLVSSIRWFSYNDPSKDRLPLRMGTAVVLAHALRVLIFVFGRVGPWLNFDVKPEYHTMYNERWNWGEVYFVSVMALLSIIAVIVIWCVRIRKRNKSM